MINYKIINITKNLDKRNPTFNSTVALEYPENMQKKTILVKPDQHVIISLSSLPQAINHLRMNGLIMIEEINEFQVNKLLSIEKSRQ